MPVDAHADEEAARRSARPAPRAACSTAPGRAASRPTRQPSAPGGARTHRRPAAASSIGDAPGALGDLGSPCPSVQSSARRLRKRPEPSFRTRTRQGWTVSDPRRPRRVRAALPGADRARDRATVVGSHPAPRALGRAAAFRDPRGGRAGMRHSGPSPIRSSRPASTQRVAAPSAQFSGAKNWSSARWTSRSWRRFAGRDGLHRQRVDARPVHAGRDVHRRRDEVLDLARAVAALLQEDRELDHVLDRSSPDGSR